MTGRVLILGVPRSGSTWVAEVLGALPRVQYIHEPDNEKVSQMAWRAKRAVGRFPILGVGDSHPGLERLWRVVGGAPLALLALDRMVGEASSRMSGRREAYLAEKERSVLAQPFSARLAAQAGRLDPPTRPAGRVRLVKSVHAALCAEFAAKHFRAHHVIVTSRTPYAVVASGRRMRMPDACRPSTLRPEVQEWALGRSFELQGAQSLRCGRCIGPCCRRASIARWSGIRRGSLRATKHCARRLSRGSADWQRWSAVGTSGW